MPVLCPFLKAANRRVERERFLEKGVDVDSGERTGIPMSQVINRFKHEAWNFNFETTK